MLEFEDCVNLYGRVANDLLPDLVTWNSKQSKGRVDLRGLRMEIVR